MTTPCIHTDRLCCPPDPNKQNALNFYTFLSRNLTIPVVLRIISFVAHYVLSRTAAGSRSHLILARKCATHTLRLPLIIAQVRPTSHVTTGNPVPLVWHRNVSQARFASRSGRGRLRLHIARFGA
ncbi:hypothetical protein FKP32DRAFT_1305774 [Trametes sanguinea]|nr:hypothetical protein FKP32DRAFT_1305774 [Trametes sanguinea]